MIKKLLACVIFTMVFCFSASQALAAKKVKACAKACKECVTCEKPKPYEYLEGTQPYCFIEEETDFTATCNCIYLDPNGFLRMSIKTVVCDDMYQTNNVPPTGPITACQGDDCPTACVTCNEEYAFCAAFYEPPFVGCNCQEEFEGYLIETTELISCAHEVDTPEPIVPGNSGGRGR